MYKRDRKKKYKVEHTGLMHIVKSLDKHFNETSKSSRKRGLIKESVTEWYSKYMSSALDDMEEAVVMVRGVLTGLEASTTSLFQECRYIYAQNGLGDAYKIDKLKTEIDFVPTMSKGMEQFVYDFKVHISFELPNIMPSSSRDDFDDEASTEMAIDDAIAGFQNSVDKLNWFIKNVKVKKAFKGKTAIINIDITVV